MIEGANAFMEKRKPNFPPRSDAPPPWRANE
jgi:1,4-dihydroxy-2-naphthoyl-CoA synthase